MAALSERHRRGGFSPPFCAEEADYLSSDDDRAAMQHQEAALVKKYTERCAEDEQAQRLLGRIGRRGDVDPIAILNDQLADRPP